MKNVVLPESPYGVWTTRSSPSDAVGERQQLLVGRGAADPVRHGRHAGLVAERVVTILESSRWRSSAWGCDDLRPASRQRLGLLVEEDERGLATGPRAADPVEHLLVATGGSC